MSAIEVLKQLRLNLSRFNKEEYNAINGALLALEQKEKHKAWLEERIKFNEEQAGLCFAQNDFTRQVLFEDELKILKEVLEKMGENKL